jgi:uncharacterized membrane protein YdjX (TVP38/TMEM64 family)
VYEKENEMLREKDEETKVLGITKVNLGTRWLLKNFQAPFRSDLSSALYSRKNVKRCYITYIFAFSVFPFFPAHFAVSVGGLMQSSLHIRVS